VSLAAASHGSATAAHRLLRRLALEWLRECAHDGVERVIGSGRDESAQAGLACDAGNDLGVSAPGIDETGGAGADHLELAGPRRNRRVIGGERSFVGQNAFQHEFRDVAEVGRATPELRYGRHAGVDQAGYGNERAAIDRLVRLEAIFDLV
jgi:hypothetical protein